MLIQILLLTFLTMWLGSPDDAVASDTDMSIDQAIIAAYDIIPWSNRSNNPSFVRVELDMIYPLDVWESMMRDETSSSKRKRRKAVKTRELLWPNAVVPYELAVSFNTRDVERMINAMSDYEKYTCIRFRKKNATDSEFVKFVDNYGCSSQVGRQLHAQELSLSLHCRTKRTIMHELGHAIGLMHEHSRPDRDQHVFINMTNVRESFVGDFSIKTSTEMDVGDIPYDYLSIMHYSEYAGSNGNIVIKTKDPKYQNKIGKPDSLSFRDAKLINRMYKCMERNKCRQLLCPGEGFVGQDCRCWCPPTNNLTAPRHCHPDANKMELEQWLLRQISVIKMNNISTFLNRTKYWPNATVPYVIHVLFRAEKRATLFKAFEQFHTYSCIRFRERMTGDDDYIAIGDGFDCFSVPGRQGGQQRVPLNYLCFKRLRIILHELSHTVGVGHKHTRPDRDDYIIKNFSNLSVMEYFKKDNVEEIYTGVNYTYLSIMHFIESAFSRNRLPTTLAKNASYKRLMGRSQNFTFEDVKRLNLMYQCAELRNCSRFIRCPGSGFVGQDCKCWCRDSNSLQPAVHCTGCTDFEEMCPQLSEFGYCTNSTFDEYVMHTCPRSCGLCSPYTPV